MRSTLIHATYPPSHLRFFLVNSTIHYDPHCCLIPQLHPILISVVSFTVPYMSSWATPFKHTVDTISITLRLIPISMFHIHVRRVVQVQLIQYVVIFVESWINFDLTIFLSVDNPRFSWRFYSTLHWQDKIILDLFDSQVMDVTSHVGKFL